MREVPSVRPVAVAVHRRTLPRRSPPGARALVQDPSVRGIPIRIGVSLPAVVPVLAWLIGSGERIDLYAGIVNRFPVVDESGSVVGAVSLDQFRRRRRRDGGTVGDVMSEAVPTVAPDTPLFDVVGSVGGSEA